MYWKNDGSIQLLLFATCESLPIIEAGNDFADFNILLNKCIVDSQSESAR